MNINELMKDEAMWERHQDEQEVESMTGPADEFLMHTKLSDGERFMDRRRMYHAHGDVDRASFCVEMRGKQDPIVRRWDPISKEFSSSHGLSKEEEDRVVWLVRKMWKLC